MRCCALLWRPGAARAGGWGRKPPVAGLILSEGAAAAGPAPLVGRADPAARKAFLKELHELKTDIFNKVGRHSRAVAGLGTIRLRARHGVLPSATPAQRPACRPQPRPPPPHCCSPAPRCPLPTQLIETGSLPVRPGVKRLISEWHGQGVGPGSEGGRQVLAILPSPTAFVIAPNPRAPASLLAPAPQTRRSTAASRWPCAPRPTSAPSATSSRWGDACSGAGLMLGRRGGAAGCRHAPRRACHPCHMLHLLLCIWP